MFHRVCIVGIGLIGGSFGLALKKHGLAREIIGVARKQSSIDEAVAIGACDFGTSDLIEAATGADLVFLAPPVGQMRAICEAIAPVLAPGALVTDAGSTKAQIVAECEPIFHKKAYFIGGHPLAGSDKTGASAARSDLFDGATWVLTMGEETNGDALEDLCDLVEAIGAKPLILDTQEHDQLLAVTSHLPHITAAALVHIFWPVRIKNDAAAQLVAGGWRDSTRIAAGSPEMWRDICLANRIAILAALDEMIDELAQLSQTLKEPQPDTLLKWFEDAARERRKF